MWKSQELKGLETNWKFSLKPKSGFSHLSICVYMYVCISSKKREKHPIKMLQGKKKKKDIRRKAR